MSSSPAPKSAAGGSHDAAVAGGEGIEEAGKALLPIIADVRAEGLTGIPAAIAIMSRFPWAKIVAKTGAHLVSRKFAELITNATGMDPATKFATALVGENLLAGIAVSGIDKFLDVVKDPDLFRNHLSAAVAKVVPTPANPTGGILAVTWEQGEGSDLVHRARVDAAGAVVQFPGRAFAQPRCGRMSTALTIHEARHPVSHRGGGRDRAGAAIPREAVSPMPFVVQVSDLPTAARAKRVPCPDCFPELTFLPSATAPKATPWHEQLELDGLEVFDAFGIFPSTTATGVDDVVAKDLGKYAAKIDPGEWNQLASDIRSDVGAYEGCWQKKTPADPAAHPPAAAKAEGLTEKGFNLIVSRINARVPDANISMAGKAEIAAHTVFDKIRHAWEHGLEWKNWNLWVPVAVSLGALLLTGGSAGLILLSYAWGWLADAETVADYRYQVLCLFGSSIAAVFWFLPMYFGDWLDKFFQGLVHSDLDEHGHPKLSNTARLTTALMLGFASVLIIVKAVGFWAEFGSVPLMHVLAAVPLAAISADRLSARWVGEHEESILHQAIDIARERIGTLNKVGIGVIIAVLTFGIVTNRLDSATSFRAVIVHDAASGQFYIPTPAGTVFRPEDILGAVEATRQEEGIEAGKEKAICLPLGADLDLPGFKEKPVQGDCKDGTTGFAMRTNAFGKSYPWERKASVFSSLEALKAANQPEVPSPAVPASVSVSAPSAERFTSVSSPTVAVDDSGEKDALPDMFR